MNQFYKFYFSFYIIINNIIFTRRIMECHISNNSSFYFTWLSLCDFFARLYIYFMNCTICLGIGCKKRIKSCIKILNQNAKINFIRQNLKFFNDYFYFDYDYTLSYLSHRKR